MHHPLMDYFVANLCMQTYQDPNILCNQKMLGSVHQWVLLGLVLLGLVLLVLVLLGLVLR